MDYKSFIKYKIEKINDKEKYKKLFKFILDNNIKYIQEENRIGINLSLLHKNTLRKIEEFIKTL